MTGAAESRSPRLSAAFGTRRALNRGTLVEQSADELVNASERLSDVAAEFRAAAVVLNLDTPPERLVAAARIVQADVERLVSTALSAARAGERVACMAIVTTPSPLTRGEAVHRSDHERREEQAGKLLERAARTVAALDPGDLRDQAARLRLAATDAEHAAQRLRALVADLEADAAELVPSEPTADEFAAACGETGND